MPAFVQFQILQKLCVAVQCGDGVFEFVGPACGHLAQTLKIAFERYLIGNWKLASEIT